MRRILAEYAATCPRCLGCWAPGTPITRWRDQWAHLRCPRATSSTCFFCGRSTDRDEYHSPQGWLAHWLCAQSDPDRLEGLVRTCEHLPSSRDRHGCFTLVGCLATKSTECPVLPRSLPRKW